MFKIRLKRCGRKKKPCYRVVAIDSRIKRDGAVKEELGSYDPRNKRLRLNLHPLQTLLKLGVQQTNRIRCLRTQSIASVNIPY